MSTKADEVEARLKKVILENLQVDTGQVSNTASFTEDLGADSLDSVELIMAFEDEFGFEIPDEISYTLTTVQEAIDYIIKELESR